MPIIKQIKEMRPEFKIAGVFVVIAFLYGIYSLIAAELFDAANNPPQSSKSSVSQKKSDIKNAVASDRPIIIDATKSQDDIQGGNNSAVSGASPISAAATQRKIDELSNEMPEVRNMEVGIDVENPVIWVYMQNDGMRKDSEAKEICEKLHKSGVKASQVLVLDASGRAKGKLIEIGDASCF